MNNRKHALLVRLLLSVALLGVAAIAGAQIPPPPVSPAPVVDREYDANGNFKKSIQAKGQAGFDLATGHDYDSLNRRFKTTDARGTPTSFGYNGREDLTSVTDPRSLVTSYPRNGLGDALGLTSPDTGSASHTVNAVGKLLTRSDSRGVLATYGYDALSRLTAITYSQSGQANQVFTWSYDQTGAGFSYGLGRLTSTQFPAGSATYGYDQLGRLVTTTQTVTTGNAVSLTAGYGYDGAGHITSITYPSGRVLYIPHSGGQPTGMSLAPNSTDAATVLITGLSFEPGPGGPGPARAWNWQLNSGTMAHTRVFDVYGRMVRFPLGGALRDLTYDAADRIIHYTHWDANSGASVAVLNQDFGYDELGRLISISTGAGTWGIGYDDNGNRSVVSYNGPGGPSTRNYVTSASSNWLQSLDNPARSLTYDAAGNLVADVQGTQSISAKIDLSGRVVSISTSGSSASTTAYAHDTFGLRVLKNVKCFAGSTCPLGQAFSRNNWTRFVYDQDGQLLGEYRGDGSVLREYVWLQGMPVAVIDGPAASPQIYYVHTDHLGAPRTVIDRSGVQRWSWVAEPFGNSAPVEDPLGFGAFNLNLRMPGQYFDVESGLAYNWNRSYDAGVGRYTQSDPIGLAGGINTYTYVNGNPIGDVDPTGEFGLLGGLVGGLGDLGYQLYRNGGNLKCVNWWEVGSWALTGSGAGIVGRAGLTGVARFFSNADKFKNISRAYWGARGGANGMSLDHWMISQAAGRSGAVSERLVSGGWNLLEMPASWNTWLGFAPNWGGTQAALANASRLGVQVGVPGVAAASGYAGYQIGTNAQQEQCGCQ